MRCGQWKANWLRDLYVYGSRQGIHLDGYCCVGRRRFFALHNRREKRSVSLIVRCCVFQKFLWLTGWKSLFYTDTKIWVKPGFSTAHTSVLSPSVPMTGFPQRVNVSWETTHVSSNPAYILLVRAPPRTGMRSWGCSGCSVAAQSRL